MEKFQLNKEKQWNDLNSTQFFKSQNEEKKSHFDSLLVDWNLVNKYFSSNWVQTENQQVVGCANNNNNLGISFHYEKSLSAILNEKSFEFKRLLKTSLDKNCFIATWLEALLIVFHVKFCSWLWLLNQSFLRTSTPSTS